MNEFYVEKRRVFNSDYLNISIGDQNLIADIQAALSTIKCVKKVNISQNKQTELTVYPKKMYSLDTVEKGVSTFLKQYILSNSIDPKIETNSISGDISEKAYKQITSAIFKYGKNSIFISIFWRRRL